MGSWALVGYVLKCIPMFLNVSRASKTIDKERKECSWNKTKVRNYLKQRSWDWTKGYSYIKVYRRNPRLRSAINNENSRRCDFGDWNSWYSVDLTFNADLCIINEREHRINFESSREQESDLVYSVPFHSESKTEELTIVHQQIQDVHNVVWLSSG